MKRLYAAAATRGLNTPTEIVRKLNISHQRIKNWESRGVSQRGANMVQARMGVSSTWILDGAGPESTGPEPLTPGGRASQFAGPDPAILHEAVTLLVHDLDHGGPRTARSASDLLLDLYRRIEAHGGRLPADEERAFEAAARARKQAGGDTHGVDEITRRPKRARR